MKTEDIRDLADIYGPEKNLIKIPQNITLAMQNCLSESYKFNLLNKGFAEVFQNKIGDCLLFNSSLSKLSHGWSQRPGTRSNKNKSFKDDSVSCFLFSNVSWKHY